jgi:hypothetical protein
MLGLEAFVGFDQRDIRRSMDVYTADGVYLGQVLAVQPGPAAERGHRVGEDARQSSEVNGELLGPMPTAPLGNDGPLNQSAAALYAAVPRGRQPWGDGELVVGRWWGLRGRRRIPLDAVQTVSLERVVLRLNRHEL